MERGLLAPEMLISAEMHAGKAQQAFELLAGEPDQYLKILLQFSSQII